MNWMFEWSPALFRSKPGWKGGEVEEGAGGEGGGGGGGGRGGGGGGGEEEEEEEEEGGRGRRGRRRDAQQCEWNSPSSIRQLCNIFHRRHWSAPGSYTSNQDEPLAAQRDTIFSFLKCLGNISACFTHTHTNTHTHTYNYLGGPKTGIMLHIF